jgi:hypothetical protein
MRARLLMRMAVALGSWLVAAALGLGVSVAQAFTVVTVGRTVPRPPAVASAAGSDAIVLGLVAIATVIGSLAYAILADRHLPRPTGPPGEPLQLPVVEGVSTKETRKAA